MFAQRQVQFAQQSATAGQHDAAVYDIGRQIWRGGLQGGHDRFANLLHRFCQGFGHLCLADFSFFGHAIEQITSTDGYGCTAPVVGHTRGSDCRFNPLSCGFPDQKVMLAAQIADNRLIHPVTTDACRARIDDICQG